MTSSQLIYSYEDIKGKAAGILFKNQAFINGRYVNALSGKTFSCINPTTGKVLTDVAACEQEDVALAVAAAKNAFVKGVWSQCSPQERKKVLLRFADLIEKNHVELALLETLDMGKPIRQSYEGDVPGAVKSVRWYAEAIDKLYDQIAPTDPKVLALITREPLGVIGAVTPWNFPLYLACAKIAPALAVGNSVIIKPAEQSPLSTIYLAQLAAEAGIPDGVMNVVPGFGETAGQALGLHPEVSAISFTGSTTVGKMFLAYSAQSNMKRVHLECGGKSPNIVCADTSDLTKAAEAQISEVFANQGEICCAPTRLLVENKIKDALLDKMIKEAQRFRPSDPLDPQTVMGAIVSDTQMQTILRYIAAGKEEGANIVLGGKQLYPETGGYFIEPTIFDKVTNQMTIAREEIFGPVLSVISFENLDEAIKLANDSPYGLTASVWTKDINKAFKAAKSLRAGTVSINSINSGDITTPFGGFNQSGIGRESSLHGFEAYTELKTTWVELGLSD